MEVIPLPNRDVKRWVFKKHTNNITKLIDVLLYLKSTKAGISIKEKEKMYENFMHNSMYKELFG